MFTKIKNPILFQGSLTKLAYFEGWYYKVVSKDQNYTLAVIPGISLNKEDSHAFIQIILTKIVDDITKLQTEYIRFKKTDFIIVNNPFKLKIGKNVFTKTFIKLSIEKNNIKLKGKISFENHQPISKSFFSPSIMGFFSYLPFMECYHGIVSMNHRVIGELEVSDNTIDFTAGKGYIEKDWGKSFPSKYIWMQSNNFSNEETSIMFSQAIIPFLGLKFKGLIVNLVINNNEYRFATYNNAKVKKSIIQEKSVEFIITKSKLKLYIKASSDKAKSLASPKNGLMNQTIKEGLSGMIYIELYNNNKLIYQDTGFNAGIEIMM
ncbi:MAG: tocopherol cyclase family protein [Bacillota bacterium]